MQAILQNFANWSFLNEPLYRWVMFFFAISFLLAGWNGVLAYMK